MTLDARYTDQDVRESAELYQVAVSFLCRYAGDFTFLVRARNHLAEHGSIPVATARGVLNCMRSDPLGAMALPNTADGRFEQPTPMRDFSIRVAEPNGAPQQPQRPAYVTLKTVWKVQYALSMHAAGQVYHILIPEQSTLRWYPHLGQFGFDIAVWCRYPLSPYYILTNDKHGRRVCKICHSRLLQYQEMHR